MPQNRLWLNTAALAIEFLLVMSGVALALNWLLRPLRKLVAATDRFGRTQEITPLRTDSGPVEVREAASAFNRMFSSIQRSFEERERFLTSFSHDLRTPLTRLRLRLEQVAQDDLREKLCADVDDLTDTLNRTITFLRSARSIERDSEGREWLYIDFRDNGPGIPEEKLEFVLEPYVRLETSRNRKTGGHGLGLSIVRNLVEASGGRVLLMNRPEGGLLVRMLFPL